MSDLTHPGLGPARIIAVALASGVAVFWIVGWVWTEGGRVGIAPETLALNVALWILAGALATGLLAALAVRGRVVAMVEEALRAERALSAQEIGAVQTNLIISWTLLEVPALLSGVLFLLLAETAILGLAVPVYALGVALTFPRSEWFGASGEGETLRGYRR